MSSRKPYVSHNGNDKIFKLEVKPNWHDDFFSTKDKTFVWERGLHNQNKLTLEKKETMYCHYVTKKSSVLCYELVIVRKYHSYDIKMG